MKKVFHSEEDYLQKFLGIFFFPENGKKSNKETETNCDILPKFIFISIKNKNYGIFYNKKIRQNITKKGDDSDLISLFSCHIFSLFIYKQMVGRFE